MPAEPPTPSTSYEVYQPLHRRPSGTSSGELVEEETPSKSVQLPLASRGAPSYEIEALIELQKREKFVHLPRKFESDRKLVTSLRKYLAGNREKVVSTLSSLSYRLVNPHTPGRLQRHSSSPRHKQRTSPALRVQPPPGFELQNPPSQLPWRKPNAGRSPIGHGPITPSRLSERGRSPMTNAGRSPMLAGLHTPKGAVAAGVRDVVHSPITLSENRPRRRDAADTASRDDAPNMTDSPAFASIAKVPQSAPVGDYKRHPLECTPLNLLSFRWKQTGIFARRANLLRRLLNCITPTTMTKLQTKILDLLMDGAYRTRLVDTYCVHVFKLCEFQRDEWGPMYGEVFATLTENLLPRMTPRKDREYFRQKLISQSVANLLTSARTRKRAEMLGHAAFISELARRGVVPIPVLSRDLEACLDKGTEEHCSLVLELLAGTSSGIQGTQLNLAMLNVVNTGMARLRTLAKGLNTKRIDMLAETLQRGKIREHHWTNRKQIGTLEDARTAWFNGLSTSKKRQLVLALQNSRNSNSKKRGPKFWMTVLEQHLDAYRIANPEACQGGRNSRGRSTR